MRTRLTELLEIEHPILCAGMGFVAVPELVAAVSNAGGLGLLATATIGPGEVHESLREIRKRTERPFGANVTLQFETSEENARILIEERVPVINLSLGIEPWIIDAVHAYGGRVLSTVTNLRHAMSAEAKGADGLIVTGHEAGGHGGEATSLVVLPLIASRLGIPVVAAGGFGDGRGLAAALVLGAEGISMGTRFALSVESPMHERVKQLAFGLSERDTLYTDRIDGMGTRFLETERVAAMARSMSWLDALRSLPKVKRALRLSWPEVIRAGLRSGPDIRKALSQAQIAGNTHEGLAGGDYERGIVPGGQVVGAIDEALPCDQIVAGTVAEAEHILRERAAATAG
ncbi:MAG: nitronate monooxygenase [Deltaproteobacteria bacterium]|jgi:enoyl-[acyl-carrier protein] reductase II|nr:nitronate monooxygenase [Deltaproteobacteria bacterium]MBW2498132.1 nitronate monooxygenase [Deltaproteobacteria bacterium]